MSFRARAATYGLLRRLLGTINSVGRIVTILPGCARSDLQVLTHQHPSFGHEQTMRVYQASLLLSSVISLSYRAFRWVRGSRDSLKTALVRKP
jgi:hypothetical protein